jgi:CRISPR-associated endonuclease/helicase Cas3
VDTPALTDAALSVWGKTDRQGTSAIGWLPLWRHLADTAAVAGRLWDGWLSPAVAARISGELPGGPGDGRALLVWLAGLHNIGKATPAFACQAPVYAGRMRDRGLDFNPERIKSVRKHAPHATAGQVILGDWLREGHGWGDTDSYGVVVGGHHGVPPTSTSLRAAELHRVAFGDDAWTSVQHELLDWMTDRAGVRERLPDWAGAPLSQPVQAVLTGLVIAADWIASAEEFFPYDLTDAEHDRVNAAWAHLDLPAPWKPVPTPPGVDTLFAARFDLPKGARPRPVQETVADLARSMPLPGMMIVEAAMGEGKTEAALAAVEIMASRTGISGCLIALPTRATSDAMFRRVLSWLQRLPDATPGRGDRDLNLAHGKAAFNPEYETLRWKSMPSGIGDDEGGTGLGVHKWLAGRKRGLLSSFVIGTIDQLLFASLRSRHLVLRHLGLAGKVIVIDEAHAYDVFMGTFLDMTLEWLGAYNVPVIVLSATLPAGRRAELMAAYDRGRLGPLPALTWRDRGKPVVDHYAGLRTDERYPLVTISTPARGGASHLSADSGRSIDIRLEQLTDDPADIADLLYARLSGGGCALIVHNTVARVQQTAAVLRDRLGPDYPVSMAHSRFMAPDRAAKDKWLRDTFGPTSDRPTRHIVVASQVAEQSLDIDFDLLITDLAPVDLVLQRIGRLHRHPRPNRPLLVAEPVCYVTGADWTVTPPLPARGSRMVYQNSALLRSAAVLHSHLAHGQPLHLPADISPLTQAAYNPALVGPAEWHPAIAEADLKAKEVKADKEKRAVAFRLAGVGEPGSTLIDWLVGQAGDNDEEKAKGHVRDSDAESLEVILLIRTPDGLVVPPWVDGGGQIVPTEFAPSNKLARLVARCTLPLPRAMTAPDVIDSVVKALELRTKVSAWATSPWLEGELVLELDINGYGFVDSFELLYDSADGLRVSKVD